MMLSLLKVLVVTSVLLVTAVATSAEEKFFPEALYKQTVETWQRKHSRRSPTSWEVWKEFATTITSKYEMIVGGDIDTSSDDAFGPSAVEIIGALEEGILTIERMVFQEQHQQQAARDDDPRDASLAVMYTEYGRLLLYSSQMTTRTKASPSSHRCYEMAKDPHTLLIGAPERLNEYYKRKTKVKDDDLELLVSLFGPLCRDNAENALRNAIDLDADHSEAHKLLETVTSLSTVHTRKPKEFAAEL